MIVVVLENTIPLCFAIHVIACFTLAAAALPCPTPPFATRMYVMSVMCRWFGTLASNSRSTRSVPPSVPWGFRRHQDLLRLTPWHARFTYNASQHGCGRFRSDPSPAQSAERASSGTCICPCGNLRGRR